MVKRFFLGLLTFILLLLLSVFWLVSTQSGLQVSFSLLNRFIPGHLTLQKMEGSLIGPLKLSGLHYHDAKLDVAVQNFNFAWQPAELLKGKLQVNELFAKQIAIKIVEDTSSSAKPTSWQESLDQVQKTLRKHLPFEIDVKNLQLQRIEIQLPSQQVLHLNEIKSQAQLEQQSTNLALQVDGKPLFKADMAAAFTDEQIMITANASASGAKLHLQGLIADTWDVIWQLDVKKLGNILPGSQGIVSTKGSITGARETPHVLGDIALSGIKFADVAIPSLLAKFDIPWQAQPAEQISLQAEHLLFADYAIDQLKINLQGKANQHQLTAVVRSGKEVVRLAMTAAITHLNSNWQATLQRGNIFYNQLGNWQLIKPVDFSIQDSVFTMSPSCWQQPKYGALCWQAQRPDGKNWQINLASKRLDTAIIKPWLPSNTDLRGAFVIDLDAKFKGDTILAAGQFNLPNGQVTIPEYGLNLRNIQLALNTDRSQENKLDFLVSAISDGGKIKIQGNTLLAEEGYPTQASIQGNRFLAYNADGAKLYISPDIKASYAKQQLTLSGVIQVPEASLKREKTESVVTLPAETVIIDKNDAGKNTQQETLQTNIQLRIVLGDKVSISIQGIKGLLRGQLDLLGKPGQPMTANGQVVIKQGAIELQGQSIKISSGQFNYINSPPDNPNLNIQAIKPIPQQSLTVGINIQGTANHPEPQLFSEPEGLSQADILTYLMLGQSSDQIMGGGNKVQTILQAANALNLGGGGARLTSVLGQIKEGLGLSQLEMQPSAGEDDSLQSTSLQLGKYLSPKLFVGYSVGFLDALNTLTIRYRLSDHWLIRSQTSEEGAGADILYTLEKK